MIAHEAIPAKKMFVFVFPVSAIGNGGGAGGNLHYMCRRGGQ